MFKQQQREQQQQLPNGNIRERNMVMAEKKDPSDSSPLACGLRGLHEEVKVDVRGGLPDGMTHRSKEVPEQESKYSPSYPGLETIYINHHICLEVSPNSDAERLFADCGLPACASFERTESKGEGELLTRWKWLDVENARAAGVRGLRLIDEAED